MLWFDASWIPNNLYSLQFVLSPVAIFFALAFGVGTGIYWSRNLSPIYKSLATLLSIWAWFAGIEMAAIHVGQHATQWAIIATLSWLAIGIVLYVAERVSKVKCAESLVTVVVSDPWEFPDENEGRLAFVAAIVDNARGMWLLRFRRAVKYQGETWHFAIPVPRHVGQTHFEGKDKAANILFVRDSQAASREFLDTFNSLVAPDTPWVVGSVERGVCSPIPSGADSYVEPTWKPKESAS